MTLANIYTDAQGIQSAMHCKRRTFQGLAVSLNPSIQRIDSGTRPIWQSSPSLKITYDAHFLLIDGPELPPSSLLMQFLSKQCVR